MAGTAQHLVHRGHIAQHGCGSDQRAVWTLTVGTAAQCQTPALSLVG